MAFKYDELPWPVAPVISLGGTDQNGWSTDYATYSKVGNVVFFRFALSKAAAAWTGSGSMVVKNLPVPGLAAGGGVVNVGYFANYTPAGVIGCFVSGSQIQFNKGSNRGVDVTGADLNAAQGILIVEGFYRVS